MSKGWTKLTSKDEFMEILDGIDEEIRHLLNKVRLIQEDADAFVEENEEDQSFMEAADEIDQLENALDRATDASEKAIDFLAMEEG